VIEEIEQHCHRFLWRKLEDREPDIYVITRVNMGDKPAGAIGTEALYLTADMARSTHPNVAQLIRTSTYVDDIVTSEESTEAAEKLIADTDNVLQIADFEVKSWTIGKDGSVEETEVKLLGFHRNTTKDIITFRSIINFSKKVRGVFTQPNLIATQIPQEIPVCLTRRMVLEQTMRIYDPFGILSPFTLQAKILLREIWVDKLGWDELLPYEQKQKWEEFFSQIFHLAYLRYDRYLKPSNAVGKPILVLLSDGSNIAYEHRIVKGNLLAATALLRFAL